MKWKRERPWWGKQHVDKPEPAQQAPGGVAGVKEPVGSSHVKNGEFYPEGTQYAVEGFKIGNERIRFMFLKENSCLNEEESEKVKQVWL